MVESGPIVEWSANQNIEYIFLGTLSINDVKHIFGFVLISLPLYHTPLLKALCACVTKIPSSSLRDVIYQRPLSENLNIYFRFARKIVETLFNTITDKKIAMLGFAFKKVLLLVE